MTSSPSRSRRKTENSCHVGVQWDRSFYGDLHKMSTILITLLIWAKSNKIPLLHKLKQLYKRLPVGFLSISHILLITYSCVHFSFSWKINLLKKSSADFHRPLTYQEMKNELGEGGEGVFLLFFPWQKKTEFRKASSFGLFSKQTKKQIQKVVFNWYILYTFNKNT